MYKTVNDGREANDRKDNGEKLSFPSSSSSLSPINVLDPKVHRFILAPMVGGSELAFRLLCRKYGTTLAYTPMMNSEKFATDAKYRETEFQHTTEDRYTNILS
jgi:hypothetical protein